MRVRLTAGLGVATTKPPGEHGTQECSAKHDDIADAQMDACRGPCQVLSSQTLITMAGQIDVNDGDDYCGQHGGRRTN